jgi:CheY-like chemotaxis protein
MQTASTSVLVADDDRELRHLIGAFLRGAGLSVVEVADGRALVELVDRLREDLPRALVVVTDVEMPEMDGLRALRRIRRTLPDVRVIVITGMADEGIRRDARRLGAAAVFEKPVDLVRLRDTTLALAAA